MALVLNMSNSYFSHFGSLVSGVSGAVCARPGGWCTHHGSTFFKADCDGDKIIDPVCSDTKGKLWYIGSASNCADAWTQKKSCKGNLKCL